MVVKGIYVTWAHDPQNPKIKDWNVTELKVRLMMFQSGVPNKKTFADRCTQASC